MKRDLIGQAYKNVFGIKQRTPNYYRALIKSYQNALVRLSKNSYKTKSLKTYDEKLVQRILADIKNIEFISQIRLNKKGVIVEAPKS